MLTAEYIITTAHASFAPQYRERITQDDIAKVVAELQLDEDRFGTRAPKLTIHRLCFRGEKRLRDGTVSPINYNQGFTPGVNVLLIPDNDVGKSTVMKTIKFALTGDNSDYDADVRTWIEAIWLVFTLDGRLYTSLLSMTGDNLRAVLTPGEELHGLDEVVETTSYIFSAMGEEQIKTALQNFFFQQLDLKALSWTQQTSQSNDSLAERSTTWRTFFQALLIPDSSDHYLICDTQHAMGNQDGLILSTFLGLSLTEPLNQLGIQLAHLKKDMREQQNISEDEQRKADEQIVRFESMIQIARERLATLDATQQARRVAFNGAEPVQRLLQIQALTLEKTAEQARLERERDELSSRIRQGYSAVRRLEEAVAFQLHFTGLTVNLCPNCDSPVNDVAVMREQTHHLCRLCGNPAHTASEEEILGLRAEVEAIKAQLLNDQRGRTAITQRLNELRSELDTLTTELQILQEGVQQGLSHAFPTPEEESERARLHGEIGRNQAEIDILRDRATSRQPDTEALELQRRILEKVRDVIRNYADQLNQATLQRLGALTQEVVGQIGAESISDLTCTPLGKLQLRKHGVLVPFGRINNQGERLRVKLAFFIAMMQLGRDPGLGRHPGLLLVDQPGSGEIVLEDFQSLAAIFRHLDSTYATEIQILCFTARSEFSEATDPSKVYGPQASRYAF